MNETEWKRKKCEDDRIASSESANQRREEKKKLT